AIDIGSLVHRDATNALVPLRLHNLASVEGTDDGGLEAALVFLRILLFSEHLARTGQFLFVKDARFRRLEHEMHPIWIQRPVLEATEMVEPVPPFRCADERPPALEVRQGWANDFWPCTR